MTRVTFRRCGKPVLPLGVLLAALSAGCDGDFEDLHALTREATPTSAAKAPAPPARLASPGYRAADKRSPFAPAETLSNTPDGAGAPERNRAKEPLESYSLDQLRMVGTLATEDAVFALVRDPAGATRRVALGDYLGMNHGRVVAVREADIGLVETVRDGAGGWMQRLGSLPLEQSAPSALGALEEMRKEHEPEA